MCKHLPTFWYQHFLFPLVSQPSLLSFYIKPAVIFQPCQSQLPLSLAADPGNDPMRINSGIFLEPVGTEVLLLK